MAMPVDAAMRRCGSLVLFSERTQNTTSPARRYFNPSFLGMILQPGGKMLETRTMLKFAMPASRRASSKLVSFSLERPTPLVRNIFLETNILGIPPALQGAGAVNRRAERRPARIGSTHVDGGSVKSGGIYTEKVGPCQ